MFTGNLKNIIAIRTVRFCNKSMSVKTEHIHQLSNNSIDFPNIWLLLKNKQLLSYVLQHI